MKNRKQKLSTREILLIRALIGVCFLVILLWHPFIRFFMLAGSYVFLKLAVVFIVIWVSVKLLISLIEMLLGAVGWMADNKKVNANSEKLTHILKDDENNMDQKIELSMEEFKKIELVIESFLQKGKESSPPRFIVLTGPIASGKTTIRRKKYSEHYVLIDSGELFDAFNGESNEDPEKKASYLMVAGIELVKRSIMEKKNIVIEITTDTTDRVEKLKQILEKMTSVGYKVEIEYIHCDLEESQKRNLKGRDNVSSYFSTDETLHYFMVYFANR